MAQNDTKSKSGNSAGANGAAAGFDKLFSAMPGFAANSPMDFKMLMETQRKNMQAFTQAQQRAMQSFQDLARKQTEIFSQLAQENSEIAREMMSEDAPEDKIAKQAEMFKKAYEHTIASGREIAEIVASSGKEAGDILNKRVAASMNELKESVQKSQKAA